MKKFNIKVNGISYEVEIEEIKEGAPQVAAPTLAKVTPKVAAPKVAAPKVEAPKAKAKEKEAVAAGAGEHSIDAPMPGKIVKVVVEEGQSVKAGDVLLVLEAMKMQNEITADADGTVKAVNVEAGQNVKVKESLVILG
ncbi:biotin/lipoyl-containing protein [Mitsuokella multacida]|jgi:biotin carboxyl carrier protein|uniref:biotin/lipoyl-containing protein n=1 Tax=Mitsuokella multacida TaxID=52226 RepID=UPI000E937201|nr:biotin/lipoyl-containing protein [Mitsuokella multacida]HBQ29996.1 acetyl-CoA carboxylase biotin carboxyl carrier protein subunit [Mitsuokella multacida]